MCILLYDNKSGHFTCFQISVLLVVSYADNTILHIKLTPPFGDLSLASLLSKTPALAAVWVPEATIPIDPSDHHLIK